VIFGRGRRQRRLSKGLCELVEQGRKRCSAAEKLAAGIERELVKRAKRALERRKGFKSAKHDNNPKGLKKAW